MGKILCKEKKRLKKKKGCHVWSVGRSVGLVATRQTRRGRVDVWWTDGGTGERGERETLEGRDVFGGSSG